MQKKFLLLSAAFICSISGIASSAAEPPKSKENMNQRASDAVKDIGDNMNKAGAAIKKTVDNAGKGKTFDGKPINGNSGTGKSGNGRSGTNKPGSNNSNGSNNVGNQLETNAAHALKTVEAGADKAEHAIVTTVKGMGNQPATRGSAKAGTAGTKSNGPSLDQSMKDFGKNAEKAGTAIENGAKKLGTEARKQVGKADQAIKKKTDHK